MKLALAITSLIFMAQAANATIYTQPRVGTTYLEDILCTDAQLKQNGPKRLEWCKAAWAVEKPRAQQPLAPLPSLEELNFLFLTSPRDPQQDILDRLDDIERKLDELSR